jgi:hypothetical protein
VRHISRFITPYITDDCSAVTPADETQPEGLPGLCTRKVIQGFSFELLAYTPAIIKAISDVETVLAPE